MVLVNLKRSRVKRPLIVLDKYSYMVMIWLTALLIRLIG